MRDPVSRIVSAFNWRSPKNGKHRVASPNGPREREFYEYFENVNEFAEALNDSNATIRMQAEHALTVPMKHIGMGLAWYLEHDIDCILQKEYRLVHAESLKEDLVEVARWLNVRDINAETPSIHSQYPMKNSTYLSDKGKKLLKAATKEDDRMLELLKLDEHINL